MKTMLLQIYHSIKDAVFPARCMACRSLFLKPRHDNPAVFNSSLLKSDSSETLFKRLMTPFLCDDCIDGYIEITSPVCPKCGQMFKERESDDHLCGDCLVKPGKISFARAAGVYDKSLMHMIKAYKYRGKTQTARPFGRLLFFLYYRHYMAQGPDASLPDMVMPVPLHNRRFRERGFNQAWLLLTEWPDLFSRIRPKKQPELVKDGLKRHRPTKPQAGLDKKSRKENIKGAFALSDKTTVRGRHVLLVDDVYTTGTTAEECASVLQKHGARRVDILTLSRAL